MRPLELVLAVFAAAPVALAGSCTAVDRDRILASDLAADEYRRLDPSLVIGLTPVPGTRRTFAGHELAAIGGRNGVHLDGSLPDVCFERAVTPLTVERLEAAMRRALGATGAAIEIVDLARQPVPSGDLDFPRSGLSLAPCSDPDAPAFWRGSLRYAAQHTLPVWAKVRIIEKRPVLVSSHEIRNGSTLSAADVTIVERRINPLLPHFETPEACVGHLARRTISGGAILSGLLLAVPPDIQPGDTVHVIATNGAASIALDAVARSPGRKGDRVVLLNPESHRTFRALVDGKGRAHAGAGD